MLIKSIMWDTNNDNEALASLPDEIETPNFLHQEDYKTMDDFFAACQNRGAGKLPAADSRRNHSENRTLQGYFR